MGEKPDFIEAKKEPLMAFESQQPARRQQDALADDLALILERQQLAVLLGQGGHLE